MALLTFEQIDQLIIEHRLAEAANRTPLAMACRALTDLREALALLADAERCEVMEEMREMREDVGDEEWGTDSAQELLERGPR